MLMFKTCTKCYILKETKMFCSRKESKDGLRSWCMECQRLNSEEWKLKNPDKAIQMAKKSDSKRSKKRHKTTKLWEKNNPEMLRTKRLRKYGLTIAQYDSMLERQNNKCAICKTHKDQFKKPLYVDHRHSDKIVRGLLCMKCNCAISFFQDNPDICDAAAFYLRSLDG
jgi:hypothetical protein